MAFTLAAAAAAVVAEDSDVHDLKTDTFDTFLNDNSLVLAECKYLEKLPSSPWRLRLIVASRAGAGP